MRFCAGLVLALAGTMAARADVVRVGWEDNPPVQMLRRGELGGIDVDIARKMIERAGHEALFVNLPWERQLKMIAAGELDLALGASITPERAEFARWTDPYREERVVLFARASQAKPVESLKSLVGKPVRIAYMRGSEFGGEFAALKPDPAFARLLVAANSNRNSLAMVRADRVQYVLEEFLTMTYMSQEDGKESLVKVLDVTREDVYFMVSQRSLASHPLWMDQFNAALRDMRKDGSLTQVMRRYHIRP